MCVINANLKNSPTEPKLENPIKFKLDKNLLDKLSQQQWHGRVAITARDSIKQNAIIINFLTPKEIKRYLIPERMRDMREEK